LLYSYQQFGFGVVYLSSEDEPTSSYISNFTSTATQFSFATNYIGLGLPENLYAEWRDLMANVTTGMSCSNESCTIAQAC
jgi:hypothetical protein